MVTVAAMEQKFEPFRRTYDAWLNGYASSAALDLAAREFVQEAVRAAVLEAISKVSFDEVLHEITLSQSEAH